MQIHGMDVVSRLEGRIYEVSLPDGSLLTLDPLLTEVKIISMVSQIGNVKGLCHDSNNATKPCTNCHR